jgi:hypothetical protein
VVTGVVLAALVVGFLAGLLSFRIKTRWCPSCGATLGCVECRDRRARHPGPTGNAGRF